MCTGINSIFWHPNIVRVADITDITVLQTERTKEKYHKN